MVRTCCVKGCGNFWYPNSDITFHSFPWKDNERLQEWLSVVPSKGRIGKYSNVCSAHFNESDYSPYTEQNRMLKKTAVPRNFGDNVSSENLSTTTAENDNSLVPSSPLPENSQNPPATSENETHEVVAVVSTSITPSTNENPQFLNDVSTNDIWFAKYKAELEALSREEELKDMFREKETVYQRKIKCLKQKISRQEEKLKNLAELIKALKKRANMSENLEEELEKRFSDDVLEIFRNQLRNSGKHKLRHRYTEKMKNFAREIYIHSPKTYKFLQTKMLLPDVSVLRKMTNERSSKIELLEDLSENIFEDISENLAEGITEDISENLGEDIAEDISENLAEGITEDISENLGEDIAEDISENLAEGITEDISENLGEDIAEDISENISEHIAEDILENISEDVAEDISEDVAEDISENIPEDISEDISENIPENESENISEN